MRKLMENQIFPNGRRYGMGALAAFGMAAFLLSGTCVRAEESGPVYDYANLLSDKEEAELEERVAGLEEDWDMNFVILTIEDAQGKSAMDYADDFYMDQGYYDNERRGGVIYLIDMDNREVRVETAHDMLYYLTDKRVDAVIDAGYEELTEGYYYGCFWYMMDQTEEFLEDGIPAGQYTYDSETGEIRVYRSITSGEAVLAILAAILAGAAACLYVRFSYRKKYTTYRYPWQEKGQFQARKKTDHIVNQVVTSRRIPKDPPPDSDGGNITTTHDSSGGGTFGGGGRSF